MFEKLFTHKRAETEAEKMKEKMATGQAKDYHEAEEQVAQDMQAREAAAQEAKTYSVDEGGVVLTEEERKQRMEKGPEAHNK